MSVVKMSDFSSASTVPAMGRTELSLLQKMYEEATGEVNANSMILSLYHGLTDKEPWRRAVQHLSAYMKAAAILVIRPSTEVDLGFLVCHPSGPEVERSYSAHYWAMDPFLDLPLNQVLTIDEYIGEERWLSSDFYRQLLDEDDIRFGMGVNMLSENGTVCRLRVYRMRGEPAFCQQDKDKLAELVEHFGQALRLAARLEHNETRSELYEGALDRLHIGAIVMDENQHILRCNQVAKSLLDEGDGIKRAAGTIEACYRNERNQLRELVNSVSDAAQAMSISRPSGKRKLGLVVRSIPLREESEGKSRPAWVIFVCDPDAQTTAPREILRQVFEFTPAEATLAMELANGLSLDEAAEMLGIRRNTARTHLRAIFAKAGVTRQAELVRLVLNGVVGLSSMVPSE